MNRTIGNVTYGTPDIFDIGDDIDLLRLAMGLRCKTQQESNLFKIKHPGRGENFEPFCFRQCREYGETCLSFRKRRLDGENYCIGMSCTPFTRGSYYERSDNKRDVVWWFW